jgi:hypothetical protein
MEPTKNLYIWMIHQDVCKRHGTHHKRIYVIIHIYMCLVRFMSLTYILMYHPHIYVFGAVHVTYIHLDVSSIYVRFWWVPCHLHTSWCIIHIYTFLVGSMSLKYILMYHPHIYVFGGVHVTYIHLDVSSTYIRFCGVHVKVTWNPPKTYIYGWYIKMYVSDMDRTKNVYMWMIHQDVCKWHGPHQKHIYVDDTSRCM